jgi:hypothetical protein
VLRRGNGKGERFRELFPLPKYPLPTANPLSHLALAFAVHQETVFLLFVLGESFVFLFIQKAVQGQAGHILPVGTAGEINFTVFVHIGFGHVGPPVKIWRFTS